MTDIEKLNELLRSWGVEYEYSCHAGLQQVSVGGSASGDYYNDTRKTVSGYPGFYTCYDFDMDGNFICIGAWE